MMSGGAFADANSLNQIKQAGVIKVGMNTAYKPFGVIDASGKIVGIEPDLANDLGKRLGVKVELVPVNPANRIQFLQQGRIDVILASMTYKPDRAKVVTFIQPYYYAGGTGLIIRKSENVKSWADLKGKTLCGVQGTFFNREVSEKYGATVSAFADTNQAVNAMINGSCVGFIEDSTITGLAVSNPQLGDFAIPLPADDVQPWGLAVSKENADTPLSKFLSDTVTDWHKSGELIMLEKKWGLPPSQWLQEQQATLK
jgi:polar amino acid transport system substrate-binding protein